MDEAGRQSPGSSKARTRREPQAALLEDSAEDLYEHAPCGYLSTLPDGAIIKVNQTFLTWTGHVRDALVGRRRFQDLLTPGSRIFHETHYAPLLHMQGTVREIAAELLCADDRRLPVLLNSVLLKDQAGRPAVIRTTVFNATERAGYERELLRARRAAEQSEARVRILQQVSARFAAPLTPADIARVTVQATVEAVGSDASAVWLLDDGAALVQIPVSEEPDAGPPRRTPLLDASSRAEVASGTDLVVVPSLESAQRDHASLVPIMEHDSVEMLVVAPLAADERRLGVVTCGFRAGRRFSDDELDMVRALGRQAGQALERSRLQGEAAESGRRSAFLAQVSRALDEVAGLPQRIERLVDLVVPVLAERAEVLLEPTHAETAERRAARLPHTLALPLQSRGQLLGSLLLDRSGARGRFRPSELSFLRELADRAALALENARLFEQQRDIAHTLQQSLLAGKPPEDPRFAVATRYRPAVETLEVGGDWYDVFRLSDDRVAVVVGDVVGRGIHAATSMGQLRSAVRALAVARLGPAKLLEHLDRFVDQTEAGRMATLAYAEVSLRSGRARFACAGHPPPALLDPHGPARFLWEGRSAPLGAYVEATTRNEAYVGLQPGSRLLLYTDGLIERRDRTIDEGLDRLAEELDRRRTAPLPRLVDGLTDAMLVDERVRDDVCLLCLSFGADGPHAG